MKFKKDDKVKITTHRILGQLGRTGTIVRVKEGKFPYLVFGIYGTQFWFKEDELEFIDKFPVTEDVKGICK